MTPHVAVAPEKALELVRAAAATPRVALQALLAVLAELRRSRNRSRDGE